MYLAPSHRKGSEAMKKWFERIAAVALIVLLVVCGIIYVRFSQWRNAVTQDLVRDSTVIETASGPIEYAELGHGPAILVVHGDPGGYDQVYQVLKLQNAEHGVFRYIIPSRPGYLRTPLSVGRTPREQAVAFAALLDALKIDRVTVIGGSGGGPSAIEFAAAYPERCVALVLEAAVTMKIVAPKPGFAEAAIKNTVGYDFSFWLLKNKFVAGLRAKDPTDPELTAIATAILNSAVPYAKRKAGWDNDTEQWSQLTDLPLTSIRCPTLILQGTADQNVPLVQAEWAHSQIAGSTLVTLPGQDHWMLITKHKELDDLSRAFLLEHSGSDSASQRQ
jgi:pimeloyl-ACP methyl ester carboxylesterase